MLHDYYLHDIANRKDIIKLIDAFYEKVKIDSLLAPVFDHVDWPIHLPTMYDFWCSSLLGDQSYHGNPFQKHVTLKINPSHFERWLHLFIETVDEHFEGDIASESKDRARNIAGVFQHKMGILEQPAPRHSFRDMRNSI